MRVGLAVLLGWAIFGCNHIGEQGKCIKQGVDYEARKCADRCLMAPAPKDCQEVCVDGAKLKMESVCRDIANNAG